MNESIKFRIELVKTTQGSNPQLPVLTFKKGTDSVIAQTMRVNYIMPIMNELFLLWVETLKTSALSSNPECPILTLIKSPNAIMTQAVKVRRGMPIMNKPLPFFIEPIETIISPNPKHATLALVDSPNKFSG